MKTIQELGNTHMLEKGVPRRKLSFNQNWRFFRGEAGGGLFISYPDVSTLQAQVQIKTHILNEYGIAKDCSVTHYIVDADFEVVSNGSTSLHTIDPNKDHTFIQTVTVPAPKLWHPEHPYLYTVYTVVYNSDAIVDAYETKIGIRHIRFDDEGFHINGNPMKLIGANRHQEYVYVGDALSDSMHRRDAIKLKEGGFSIVRTGHYPQSAAWMIRYHRNRPSVVLWEPILNETDYSEQYARTTYEITHAEYPGDQCYAACDSYKIAADVYDVVYGEAVRDRQGAFIREWGDHWLEQAGPRQTHLRCSRGTRDFYPGGESGMLQSSKERADILNRILDTKGLSGGALWTGIDTNRGYYDHIAACGALDIYRLPKYSYYLFQSQIDPYSILSGIPAPPMVFIASHWTPTSTTDITIYSNCQFVKLYLNGRLLGVKEADPTYGSMGHAPFLFERVPWEAGELSALAEIDGAVAATHTVRTPETPEHLTLSVDDCGVGLKADGSDLIMVHAYVRDASGSVIPDAYNRIAFRLTGPAEIVGDGDHRVGSNPIEAEAGAIGVLIRATKEPGTITLHAESEGLRSATVEIMSKACTTKYVPGKSQIPPEGKPVYAADLVECFSPPPSRNWVHWCDIAINKPAKASSELFGCSANHATSGIVADRWSERWSAGNKELPQWWKVDLEGLYELDGSKIYWESDNTVYEYQVEVSSDDIFWKTVASRKQTGQDEGVDEFHETGIRYVRIVVSHVSKGLPSFYVVKVRETNGIGGIRKMSGKKIRIGIIGLDTSHASAFTQLLHDKNHAYHVPGGEVTVAYPGGSDDFEMSYSRVAGFTEQMRGQYGVAIVDSPEAVAEGCDAILLESADGRVHLEQFRRIAAYRKPVFIDKPMAVSSADAREIADLARMNGVPLMSCSALRYAEGLTEALLESEHGSIIGMDCYGPMALQPTQPGLFWYGVHTVEMLFRTLGKGCKRVTAVTNEEHDFIIGEWEGGTIGTIRGNRRGNSQFGALLHRETQTRFIDVYHHPKSYYASLLEKIMILFLTGKPDIDLEETLQIIRFMEAANESRESGLAVNL